MADDLSKWWDEDAERLNKMAIAARKMAVKLPTEREDRWEDAIEEERAWCPTGPGGGLDNSCGGGTAAVVREVLKSIEKTGGFSVHPVSAKSPTTGFMCATVPHAEKIFKSSEEITEPAIQSYIDQHKDFLSENPKLHLGGWIDPDTEKVYLDLSEQFEDEASAVAAGVKHNQLAIWDVKNKREVRIRRDENGQRSQAADSVRLPAGGGSQGDRRSSEQSSRGVAGKEESRAFCATGEGGGIDNSCGVEGDEAPSDSFGNVIDAPTRSPSSTMGGGGRSSWKKSDDLSFYDSNRLKSDPPSPSLAEVNTVTILSGRTLSASLKEVGVTLDQAAKVCCNLSPESNVTMAHGTLKEITSRLDDLSGPTDPESSVTVISSQSFGGVDKAIGTAATLTRTDDDELLLNYAMFSVAPESQKENPIAIARAMYSGVVKSITEAEKAGVEEVGMYAAGDSDSNDEFKGYRIWPRLGFDGIIPRDKITPTYSLRLGFFEPYGSNIPNEILSDRARQEKSEGVLTIQALYDTKEGQRWWEENGGAMPMFLRVGDSEDPGWQRFKKISSKVSDRDIIDVIDAEWRSFRGEAEERGFCPTGEGGGIDNSCGGLSGVKMAPDRDMGSSFSSGGSVSQGPASVRVESEEKLQKSISAIGASSVEDVISLGGGNLRGAQVAIAADPEPDGTGSTYVQITTASPVERDNSSAETFNTQVSISVGPNGKEVGFESLGLSGHGSMTKANEQKVMSLVSEKVIESIATAERLDFDRITTFAIGDSKNGYKGYRLWPQFGFDGDIPRDIVKKIPPELILASKGITPPPPGSTSIPHDLVVKSLASRYRDMTIQELLKTREGDRWWDNNGDDIVLKLDLRDKSSLGYKRWKEMEANLPRLRERNQTREFFDAFVEERDADCGRTPDGKFGNDNKCQEEGEGGATATAGGGALAKARNVDVMIGGGKTTAVIDEEARTRALEDTASHPRPEGLSSGSTADLWDRTFVERKGSTKTKITSTDPVFPQDRLAMNGTYVAHESVGQYLSMRHEEDRAAAGGVGPGAIIDTTQVLTHSQFTYVSDALSDDVMHAYESGRFDPGFYSKDLEDAMTKMASRHPELATDENGRFVFTMLTAILSNGQDPTANIADSDGVYAMYKEHGTCMPEGSIAGTRSAAAKTSLALFQSMIDSFGVERTKNLLSGYTTAENVNKTFASLSEKSSNAEWRERTDSKPWMIDHYKARDKKTGEALATTNLVKTDSSGEFKDEIVPMASIFGPKIGSFFANLNGRHDFLTMDRWLMRSVGRTTGELLTRSAPQGAKSRAEDAIKALDVDKWKPSVYMFGIDRQFGVTKQDLIRSLKIQQRTGVIEENGAAYLWATAAERSHKNTTKPNGGGYGRDPDADKHACHVAGNALFKSLIHEQQDPRGAQARRSIREVFRSVVKDIEAKYPDRKGKVDVDEVQAILWQYEKNLWKHLGAKVQIDENSLYSKAADDLLTGKTKERKFKPESRAALLEALRDIGDSNDDWQFQAEQESWDSDIGESGIDFNQLFLELERIVSAEKAPSALESAKDTVIDLRSVGLSTVEMPKAGLDGLHVMGFDAEIPPDLIEKLPESLSHCKTLLDLHVSSEGQEWWKENGRDIDVAIDLDGVQGQIFDSFAAGKRWEEIIEEGILDDYGNS